MFSDSDYLSVPELDFAGDVYDQTWIDYGLTFQHDTPQDLVEHQYQGGDQEYNRNR